MNYRQTKIYTHIMFIESTTNTPILPSLLPAFALGIRELIFTCALNVKEFII